MLEAWKKVENSVVSMVAVGLAVDEEASAEASAACTAAGESWCVVGGVRAAGPPLGGQAMADVRHALQTDMIDGWPHMGIGYTSSAASFLDVLQAAS